MSIKTTNNIKDYVDDFFDNLELYDDYKNNHDYKGILKSSIDVFLNYENDYTAKEVYHNFFMIYQITPERKSKEKYKDNKLVSEPNTLLDLVETMEKYEKNTGMLIERQRDHFIHSVNVFILGLAIYSQNENYREVFKEYIETSKYGKYYKTESGELSHEEFLYRWGIASLFHDIGYPFEIIGKQLNKFINDGVKSISNAYDVNVTIDFEDFDEFNSIVKLSPYSFADDYREDYPESKVLDLFKPTEIMAHKISRDFDFDKEKFKLLLSHLNNFVTYMKKNIFIDHGFYSSILVLNSYGSLIQKYGRNNSYFFYPIVDSATAILLHNYYNKTLQEEPFCEKELSCEKNPIAYLLILCDELQEWNRQPFGLIDLKKSHVNDLIIEIDDEMIKVEYKLNNGSMGLGFSKDKQEFIESVLDMGEDSVFERGISIKTTVNDDVELAVMRGIDFSDIETPDMLIRNIELLAKKINEQYNVSLKEEYERKSKTNDVDENLQNRYDALCEFNELSSDLKLSNIRQAKSIPMKLNMIGCEIVNKSDEREPILEFSDKELTDLAIFEHNEWVKEKENTGWILGDKKDEEMRTTPFLVPWEDLSEDDQKYDKDAIRNIPALLDSIGLKAVNSKIKILTFKMHEEYLKRHNNNIGENIDSAELFDELDDYIKFSNYKQAKFNIKLLNERGYDLVPRTGEDWDDEVKSFSKRDLEHFAKREHKAWFKLKSDLGWKYGPKRDDENKINPNLRPWKKLDKKVQNDNMKTFEVLPRLCADPEVNLKIVKSE